MDWVQLDEPILALDLPAEWLAAFHITYQTLAATPLKLLLATYFGSVAEHADLLHSLPLAGMHLDLVRAPEQLATVLQGWPQGRVLSAGLIDGRNIWRNDLSATLARADQLRQLLGEQLWLAPSCNLLHTPVDLAQEVQLNVDLKSWLAFSVQKLNELKLLKRGLVQGRDSISNELAASDFASQQRRQHPRIHRCRCQRAPGHAAARQRPSPQPLPGTGGGPGRVAETAATAHHHNRFVPANRRDPQRPCRVQTRRTGRCRLRASDESRNRTGNPQAGSTGASMYWCTGKPNATTWWNTLANSWQALPLPNTAGYKATAAAA